MTIKIHQLVAEILDFAVEFTCLQCSFRSQWSVGKGFTLITPGDPHASHNHSAAVPKQDDEWLTPELRAQVDRALGGGGAE